MAHRTSKDATNVRKLLSGTLKNEIGWHVGTTRRPHATHTFVTELGDLSVHLWKAVYDRGYAVWLAIEPKTARKGLAAGMMPRREDAFSDDELREAGLSTAAAALIELYSLADRRALKKDELVDELADALATIPEPEEEEPKKRDDDIPF